MKNLRAHQHWLPVMLWMGFIFVMSTEVGTASHTSRILGPLLKWLVPSISSEAIGIVHTLVRKGGHLTEYAVLALLGLRAVLRSQRGRNRAPSFFRSACLAALISAAYATTDEFHQSFVPGRTASGYDVAIDTTGAVAALAAAAGWRRIRRPAGPKKSSSSESKSHAGD